MTAKELKAPYLYVMAESQVSNAVGQLRSLESNFISNSILGIGKRSNLKSLKGVGKELWIKEDAQEYINKLRNEWNE